MLEKSQQILGKDHPDTLTTKGNLASMYWAQRRTAEAARLEAEVLEKRQQILREDYPYTLTAKGNLASTY